MVNGCCACPSGCMALGLVVSGTVGTAAALLRIAGVLAVPAPVLVGVFVLAAVYLATLLVVTALLRSQFGEGCRCPAVRGILAGIPATALSALMLLAIPFGATGVVGALVTGILAAGISLIFWGTACLVKCLTGCRG